MKLVDHVYQTQNLLVALRIVYRLFSTYSKRVLFVLVETQYLITSSCVSNRLVKFDLQVEIGERFGTENIRLPFQIW